ncbi:MAG: small multi-drug export protein [Candidatus Krumholzibacteria bacterium]|nr:small multi-drug export protein [Candidatus Krumholzibacteria bacterium]
MAPALAFAINVSPKVVTFVIAMLPISELRGAIPYALAAGKMHWLESYIITVAGNFVPVIPILLSLERVSERLMKYPALRRFFEWFFERAKRRGGLVARFEAIGLTLFVAVPLPVTGAWTGCAAAVLFGIPLRLAVPAILLGIMIAGGVVTLASLGLISFWGL